MIDAVCIPISCLFQSSFTHTETKIEYIYEPKYRNNSIYDNIILGFCQSRYKGKYKWCKYERIVLFFQKKIKTHSAHFISNENSKHALF